MNVNCSCFSFTNGGPRQRRGKQGRRGRSVLSSETVNRAALSVPKQWSSAFAPPRARAGAWLSQPQPRAVPRILAERKCQKTMYAHHSTLPDSKFRMSSASHVWPVRCLCRLESERRPTAEQTLIGEGNTSKGNAWRGESARETAAPA